MTSKIIEPLTEKPGDKVALYLVSGKTKSVIYQFRYIKIQPQTIDLSTRLWGINTEFVGVYSPEPRSEVYCLRLNFNISKLVYGETPLRRRKYFE